MQLYDFVMAENGYLLEGPLALTATSDFLGDLGGGATTQVDTGGGEPAIDDTPVETEVGDEEFAPEGEGETEAEEPEGREREPQATPEEKAAKEVLPKELSKAIRELKQAHPEQAQALKALNDAYYTAKSYKSIYATPDEARVDKAAIEAMGGHEGIAGMRQEISSIRDFDRLAEEGDPAVINGLAEQFPDGFKRLVPVAIDRLAKSDPEAFRETMRGPILQAFEGDGVIAVLRSALEELKLAGSEPDFSAIHYRNAQGELSRINGWYEKLKSEEQQFKGRYQDPRLEELKTGNQKLQQDKVNFHQETVNRGLDTYLRGTMQPAISKVLNGRQIPEGGRARFERLVTDEIRTTLLSDKHYVTSMRDFIRQGEVERAESFAKPFIDRVRQPAINKVYTDFYGSAPQGQPKPRPRQPPPTPGNGQPQPSNRPALMNAKPSRDQIDWDKTKTLDFINNRAYLKGSGKLVTWRES